MIQTRLKGYYNNAINVRMFLDRYGSKIQKISRYRPTISNETILATKQEFFFTKVAPVQNITDIVLLGFWLILFPGMFISSYTTIYIFVNNFFSNVYISVNTIFECSYLFFWMRNRLSIKYVRNLGNGGGSSKLCAGAYLGRGVEKLVIRYVRTKWMDPSKCCGIFFVHWFGQEH